MAPKEELIQAIERSPDELIRVLLDLVRLWQQQIVKPCQEQPRVYYEGNVLVVDTEAIADFNFNHFIDELREERIQELGSK
ncbi:MAG: hypothetical protein KME17_09490 [Cyanosarcina radialis HA8281-LM2]|jgi:protoporphyrinogen oxidase|nr:hypothetical protein [Cyanosarcina radialis HA8281-LM2]